MSEAAVGKHFEKLTINSDLPAAVVIDFMALCSGGSVVGGDTIDAKGTYYKVDTSVPNELTVSLAKRPDVESQEDLIYPIYMQLAAAMLGAKTEVTGDWGALFPSPAYLAANLGTNVQITDLKKLIHPDSCLTLDDLKEIHAALTTEKRPASEFLSDKKFIAIFPAVQEKWGEYGFARHHSGTEIKTRWNDREFIYAYGYNSPNPCEIIYESWQQSLGKEVEEDYFKKFRVKDWSLAKQLSKVPAKDKQRVYEWVISTKFDVEEYHETRGGKVIPETFECEFGNCIMTADRNANFELIEV